MQLAPLAPVTPIRRATRLHLRLGLLAEHEAAYQEAREVHASAETLMGLAVLQHSLTMAHRHAVESAAQRLHEAAGARDAAVTLLLREVEW